MSVRTLLPVLALLVVNGSAPAQQGRLRPVAWTLSPPVANVAELRARIASGWHIYSLTQPPGGPRATRIEVVSDPPFSLVGPVGRHAPDTIPDAIFGIMSEVYEDSVTFHLPLATPSPPPPNGGRLAVAVTYQACTSRLCLRPRTDTIDVAIRPRH